MRNCLLLVAALIALGCLRFATAADESKKAPRDLLVSRDNAGGEHRIATRADWLRRRAEILEHMQEVMGKLPDRSMLVPLDVKILERVEEPGYTRLKISFASTATSRVPAYLLLPKGTAGRRPAILALHQTTEGGKAQPVGLSDGANLHYGRELAERGYVVLAPDYPSFGDRKQDLAGNPHPSATILGIWDHMRAVDLLVARDDVDAQRIGVIGHSLGGHNSIFVAAFDERLKVVVTSCGWTPFHDYYGGNLKGWSSDKYMPRIRTQYALNPDRMPFDFDEVIAALAPRGFFSISPLSDDNFAVAGVKRAAESVRPVYKLLDATDRFQLRTPDASHDFPPKVREEAYQFIDSILKADLKPQHKSALEEKAERMSPKKIGADDLRSTPLLEPAEALDSFELVKGFELEQVAAEPLVASPVAMAFDERGRMYVAEMRDYPESPQEKLGRVRLLTDTDGDGRFDRSSVFVEGLAWPTAVACYDGGIFVGAAPDILYCKDLDGDGRADVRKVVFTGFNHNNVQGLLNSFTWGLDNRIYGATSGSGAEVRRSNAPDKPPLKLRGRDFAFDPRTLEIEATSGGAQHGLTFDDWGNELVCSNSDHLQAIMYADRYIARNKRAAAPGARLSIAADGPQADVYRISPVEPWRVLRTQMRLQEQARGPIEGGGRAAGYFTSATGITVYRGDAWPAEYKGQVFVGDVGGNLVHRKRLELHGLVPIGQRIDQGKEFLASRDIWFRPVGFANAPDGTLYVMDMYREVIEHPDSLPPEIKKHLVLSSGRESGRIYRIVPKGFRQQGSRALPTKISQLVETLGHANGWHRDTAARLIYERQDPAAVEPLKRLARRGSPLARLHALYALDGLKKLDEGLLRGALADSEPRLRVHAIRLAEPLLDGSEPLRTRVYALVDDPDIRVRYQLAFTLGQASDAAAQSALVKLAVRDGDNAWMRVALVSSMDHCAAPVLAGLIKTARGAQAVDPQMIELVAGQVGVRKLGSAISDAVTSAERLSDNKNHVAQAVLRGIFDGLRRSGSDPTTALGELAGPDAVKVFERMLARAREAAVDPERATDVRASAISLLGFGRFEDSQEIFQQALEASQQPQLQLAALAALKNARQREAAQLVVDAWPQLGPHVREEAVEVLFSRTAWLPEVLAALENDKIHVNDVDPARLEPLRSHSDDGTRRRVLAILGRRAARRADVIEQYREALRMPGTAAAGKLVFQQSCSGCHKLQGTGQELGPNLAAARNRGAETILVNVLDPNREVYPQYVNWFAVTDEGQTLTGMITAEGASSVTLTRGHGASDTVTRDQIDELHSTGLSLMPEGLEKQINQQAMADLLAYLMSVE